ncbi:hypothetical protein [Rhodobacter maris]|uniref:Uncharacterized protein n=1 Tax=Rhodobacter maris TaxID=446682 RepID=A0A285RPK7_9RHOB|nr:hypothetical protein [Rhodobacter maris]SOB94352.1 hypothetical protein SAMN05877831_101407 [Rhodobacter maris]
MMDLPQLSGLGTQSTASTVAAAPPSPSPPAASVSFEEMLAPSGSAEMQALVMALASVDPVAGAGDGDGAGAEAVAMPRSETGSLAPAEGLAPPSLAESLFSARNNAEGTARDTMSGGVLSQQYKALLNGIR